MTDDADAKLPVEVFRKRRATSDGYPCRLYFPKQRGRLL